MNEMRKLMEAVKPLFEGAYGKRVDTGKASGIAYGIYQLQGGTYVAAPIRVNENHPLHDDDHDFGSIEDAHKHAIQQLSDYRASTGDWGEGGSRVPWEGESIGEDGNPVTIDSIIQDVKNLYYALEQNGVRAAAKRIIVKLEQHKKEMAQKSADSSWDHDVDRMGGSFSDEEIARSRGEQW